jgi:hypothetical protein
MIPCHHSLFWLLPMSFTQKPYLQHDGQNEKRHIVL